MISKIPHMVSRGDKVATTQPTHPYTFTFTTSFEATPTYLLKIQQSELNPVFIGKYAKFFHSNVPADFGAEHILLIPGKGKVSQLDMREWKLRTHWSFTVESDFVYMKAHDGTAVGSVPASVPPEGGELREALSGIYWDNRVGWRYYILRFMNFDSEESEEKYKTHIRELAAKDKVEVEGTSDIQIHLSGRITQMGPFKDRYHNLHHEEEAKQHFTLMSCGSEVVYAEYLASQTYQEMQASGVKESMVITRQMWLPPKIEKINPSGWEYGNPHEPYGQDWFG